MTWGIPSVSDACWRVETVRAGSLPWTITRGITGDRPEIVRQADLHRWQKGAEPHRNDAVTLASASGVTDCFLLGSLVAHAPFYSGILQGLQVSDVTPYS
jgi:hypothetical protein